MGLGAWVSGPRNLAPDQNDRKSELNSKRFSNGMWGRARATVSGPRNPGMDQNGRKSELNSKREWNAGPGAGVSGPQNPGPNQNGRKSEYVGPGAGVSGRPGIQAQTRTAENVSSG